LRRPHCEKAPASALLTLPLAELLQQTPLAAEFFTTLGLALPPETMTPAAYFALLDGALLEDLALERESLAEQFSSYLELLATLHKERGAPLLDSLTIQGGHDKSNRQEAFSLTIRPGEIVSLVGPTGSGKSRFLADIEWLAQGDSPTGRTLLINGAPPEPGLRFAIDRKLVAQLSQNMNFVMDLSVEEFITMHAESRMMEDIPGITKSIIALANELAGERFSPETPVTSLSGGQSRALMIADTSCLSNSPIVLIDEIENAGIDRKRAVRTLVDRQKIVLMATHDPILALMGDRRLVFKNGGIAAIITTSDGERANLKLFEEMDAKLGAVRNALRNGERIEQLRWK
jgi:ABC-type lipoprotein export system ATPase subunit